MLRPPATIGFTIALWLVRAFWFRRRKSVRRRSRPGGHRVRRAGTVQTCAVAADEQRSARRRVYLEPAFVHEQDGLSRKRIRFGDGLCPATDTDNQNPARLPTDPGPGVSQGHRPSAGLSTSTGRGLVNVEAPCGAATRLRALRYGAASPPSRFTLWRASPEGM